MNEQSSLEARVADLQAQVKELQQGRLSAARRRSRWGLPVLLAAVILGGVALAQPTSLIVFAANKPAVAADVNANFTFLNNRIDALLTPGANQKVVPTGTIAFFASACPPGWAAYANAQGRFVVGTPNGGQSGLKLGPGAALSNGVEPVHQHHWASKTSTHEWQSYPEISPGVGTTTLTSLGGTSGGGSGPDYAFSVGSSAIARLFTSTESANLPYVQLNACVKQ